MSKPNRYQREEYIARINRVIDYIEAHIDEPMKLEKLAEIAHFSPYHFHRIFSAMMGEPLNRFVQRIRIEKAAAKLTGNPRASITEVALDFGFSSSAAFSRAFKEAFGVTASEWRAGKPEDRSKIRKTESNGNQTVGKDGKDIVVSPLYPDLLSQTQHWRIEMKGRDDFSLKADVQVKEMPGLEVAYVRHVGPYAGDAELFQGLFEKLMKWAGARGLLRFPETQILCVYHDDPNITDGAKLRTSACLTVPADTPAEGEIGRMNVDGGKYAVARFELADNEYEEAWQSIYGGWLPESGYQPDDRPNYELYQNDPSQHPEGKCIVDICIPVKPL